MRAALRTLSLGLATPLFVLACTGAAPEHGREVFADTELPLVGGRLAQNGEYGSTVEIAESCTGTKVGPRHFLLAAHCVHNTDFNTVQARFLPGATVRISGARVAAYETYEQLTVEATHIFPAWTSACVTPCPLPILAPSHPADVAVLIVREETPRIPAAEVDPMRVADDKAVVVAGFGCENGLDESFTPRAREVKVAETHTLPKGKLLHPGSFVSEGDVDALGAAYVVTPGHAAAEAEASLCFGDSGGPLYRGDTLEPLVVGINAYYTFPAPSRGISQTNWHTRLDASAPGGVTEWLEARGVAVHHGYVSPKPEPAPAPTPTRVSLTTRLEAEEHTRAAEGVGYHDSDSANQGGEYRTGGVDIEKTTDDGGGYNVGWTAPDEWLSFDVTAAAGGVYDLSVRVASPKSGRHLHVNVDGRDVTGPIVVPTTGSWQTFTTVTVSRIAVAQGDHTVRVVFDTDGVNLNWLAFAEAAETPVARPQVEGPKPEAERVDPSPASPCAGLCASPTTFAAASYSASSLGTGARCFETRAALQGLDCGDVVAPRTFAINGAATSCDDPSIALPAPRNGGYCIALGAGDAPWAWFTTW